MQKIINLHDLDELAITVRNETSKSYILESIAAYKAGAYRASIVSTWIAISYDIIAKIREIADQGDGAAKAEIENLEKYIKNNDIYSLQRFEGDLLDKSKDTFEFINTSEYNHLNRIKEDRNYSAHPAYINNEQLFEPTGELARNHIVHAVIYLLQYKPTQGNTAFKKIIRDVKRDTFPQNYSDVKKYVQTNYFEKAKEALIKKVVVGFLKGILGGGAAKDGTELNLAQVLQATSELYHNIFSTEAKKILNIEIDKLDDNDLWRALVLMASLPIMWGYLNETTHSRIKNFLAIKASKTPEVLGKYSLIKRINIPDLEESITNILNSIDQKIRETIDHYNHAETYFDVDDIGKREILPLIPYFTPKNLNNLLDVITNSSIILTSGSEQIIESIYNNSKHLFSDCHKAWENLIPKLEEKEIYCNYKHLLTKLRIAINDHQQTK